jgi:hypothetical protein
MEPILPNSASKTCGDAISSNCVQYNGKMPSCIPICAGDTVSDMIYKLGQQMCYDQSLINLTGLDLSCFYTGCPQGCTQPTTIVDAMQIITNYICVMKQTINALSTQITLLGGTAPAQI